MVRCLARPSLKEGGCRGPAWRATSPRSSGRRVRELAGDDAVVAELRFPLVATRLQLPREQRRGEDVVEAPAEVPLPRARPVLPPGVVAWLAGMKDPKA